MAGLEDKNIIDLVVQTKEGVVELVIVEEGTIELKDIDSLIEKINSYISFVREGQFEDQYPQLRDKPVIITVTSFSQPNHEVMEKFKEINGVLIKSQNINFQFKLMRRD